LKILITGGTGLIGGAIAEAAVRKGHEVWILSRKEPSGKISGLDAHFICGDWYDDRFVESTVSQDYDVVVDTLIFNENQMERTIRIINGHCRQFLYISTDSVYPHPGKDVSENDEIDINDIKWKYGYDKLKAERYLESHEQELSFFWTVIRPTVTFGDTRLPAGFVSKRNTYTLAERILNNKPVIRFDDPATKHALCHVSVFGEAVSCLLMNEAAAGHCYHISDNKSYTYDDIFRSIEKTLGTKGIYVHLPSDVLRRYNRVLYEDMIYDKVPEFTLDNSLIREICPDVEFSVDIDAVIAETLQNLKSTKSAVIQDQEYDVISDLILLNEADKISDTNMKNEVAAYTGRMTDEQKRTLKAYESQNKRARFREKMKKPLRSLKHKLIKG